MSSFKFGVFEEKNVARERFALFDTKLKNLKESISLKILGVHNSISKEVQMIGELFSIVQKNFEELISSAKALLEDIRAFMLNIRVSYARKKLMILLCSNILILILKIVKNNLFCIQRILPLHYLCANL